MASRLAGSSDIFNHNNRNIWSSINFVTAHDGFNINDLVSYNGKHNLSNGENNQDGTNSNWSWNSGLEGDTDNSVVLENRFQRARGMLSTLLLSFGTPMLVAGDEFMRTQLGNNNPYCQDNALTWITWEGIVDANKQFANYIRKVIRLRKKLKIFERRKFFTGAAIDKSGYKDIAWYTEKGKELDSADWHDGNRRCLSYCVYNGNRFVMVIFNANFNEIDWKLPMLPEDMSWHLLLDSSQKVSSSDATSGHIFKVPAWSVLVFEIKK